MVEINAINVPSDHRDNKTSDTLHLQLLSYVIYIGKNRISAIRPFGIRWCVEEQLHTC